MSDEPHIVLSYQEDVPDEILREFLQTVDERELRVLKDVRPITPFASFEWAVPTLIVIFVLRSYFDAFMKEAGKDHYRILKKSVGSLLRKLMGSEPESRPRGRSLIFSVQSNTRSGAAIKFVFPEGVSLEAYDVIVASMLEMLASHHFEIDEDPLARILEGATPIGRTYYLEFSQEIGGWTALDWREEARRGLKDKVGGD